MSLKSGETLRRKAISSDSLAKISKPFYPKQDFLSYEIKAEDKVAILTINTFDKGALKNAEWKYKKYIKDFFKEIEQQQVQSLIIDLSRNSGGKDNYASYLYRFLTKEAFVYYKKMQLNAVPEIKAIEDQVYLPDEIRSGLIRKLFIKRSKGEYLVKPTFRTKGLRKQGPKANAFTGPVYFLISGASFSASAELASYAKAYRPNIYFIGQETGGAAQGNTSALSAFLVLKNSKLATYIPMVRYNMNITDYEQGRGVMPDYEVEYSLQSVRAGKNDFLEKALQLCREKE